MSTKPKKILLLDYCSEKNRGDAAMQVGLLNLVIDHMPEAEITILSVFGANQELALVKEYDHSINYPARIVGGIKPTFFPIEGGNTQSQFGYEILQLLAFIPCLLFLALTWLRLPQRLLRSLLPERYHPAFDAIATADLVLWNGRNFRSRKNRLLEIYRTLHIVYHPLLCAAYNKTMACIGGSVWSLNSSISRGILRRTFNRCVYITLREKRSYDTAVRLMGSSSKLILRQAPDLSFASFTAREEILAAKKASNTETPKQIGLTVVDWSDDGSEIREQYIQSIRESCRYLVGLGAQITIVPQVTKCWESNTEIVQHLIDDPVLKGSIDQITGIMTVDDLLKKYAEFDLLIATRMHSAIFAAAVNTSVVAIAYDTGGKWSIIEGLGVSHLLTYGNITPAVLIDAIRDTWKNREKEIPLVAQNAAKNIQNVTQNIYPYL